MSADDGSVLSDDLSRYRNLADAVRALIDSGTLHAHETLDDLLQLAAWYERLAEQAAHRRKANDSTEQVRMPPAPAETE